MADRYATQNLNRVLTNYASETFRQLPGVADLIAPVVPVPTTTGKYYVFANLESARADFDDIRAPKSESNEISRSYSSADYGLTQHGLRELIGDEEMDNADRGVIDPEQDAMLIVTQKLRLAREMRVCTKVMSSSNYGSNHGNAAAAWNADSGVDIEGDIKAAIRAVRITCGMAPNTIVIPPHIADAITANSAIKDLRKYTEPDLVASGQLPRTLFTLRTVVPMMIGDEADPGISTASKDFVWDDNSVAVLYVDSTISKKTLSFMKTLRRYLNGQSEVAAFRYRDDGKHGTWIEGLIEEDIPVTAAGAGYLITTAYSE